MTTPDAFRALLGGFAAVALALVAPPAWAQTFTASINSDPNLGNVVAAATGPTIFRFSPSGSVTALGGGAVRASYTVTGEGGQAISVSVPPSFTMSGSTGDPITVTLVTSGLPTSLSAAPGSEGSASFYVGGTFTMNAGVSTGDYSGVYSVTAQYN